MFTQSRQKGVPFHWVHVAKPTITMGIELIDTELAFFQEVLGALRYSHYP